MDISLVVKGTGEGNGTGSPRWETASPVAAVEVDACAELALQLGQQQQGLSGDDLRSMGEEELLQVMDDARVGTVLKNRVLQQIGAEKRQEAERREDDEADAGAAEQGDDDDDGEMEELALAQELRLHPLFFVQYTVLWTLLIVSIVFLANEISNLSDLIAATSSTPTPCTLWAAKATCSGDGGWMHVGPGGLGCDGAIDATYFMQFTNGATVLPLPSTVDALSPITTRGGATVLTSDLCPNALRLGAADGATWKLQALDPVSAPELLHQRLRVRIAAARGRGARDVAMRSFVDGSGLCAAGDAAAEGRSVAEFSLEPLSGEGHGEYLISGGTEGKRRYLGATAGERVDLWHREQATVWTLADLPLPWLEYLDPSSETAPVRQMCAVHRRLEGQSSMRQALDAGMPQVLQAGEQATCFVDTARQACHLGITVTAGPIEVDPLTGFAIGRFALFYMIFYAVWPILDMVSGFRGTRRIVACLCPADRAGQGLVWLLHAASAIAWICCAWGLFSDSDAGKFLQSHEAGFEPGSAAMRWHSGSGWETIP
jgi:hypothetical protein